MNKFRQTILFLIFSCHFLGTAQAQWEQVDSVFIDLVDCSVEGEWCLGIPLLDIVDYTVVVNDQDTLELFKGCEIDTFIALTYFNTFGQGNLGPYYLDSWVVDGQIFSGEFLNIPNLVDSMNIWDPSGNWTNNPASFHISGGSTDHTYSDMAITVVSIDLPSTIVVNLSQNEAKGVVIPINAGITTISVTENATNITQHTTVIAACPQSYVNDITIGMDEDTLLCFTGLDLGLAGTLINLENVCPSDGVASYMLVDDCLAVTGNTIGNSTACYQVCDEYGFCADLTWNITVDSDNTIYEQDISYDVLVYNGGAHCFDLSQLNGSIEQTIYSCGIPNGEIILFETINDTTYCLDFSAINIGTDSICVNFIDSDGNILAATVTVNALAPPSEWIDLTINMGDSTEICLDISELNGNLERISNLYQINHVNSVFFDVNDVSLCTNVLAESIGVDTACIVACDNNLICDTTYYQFTVLASEISSPPTANNDNSQTLQNTSVVINFCENDIIPDNNLTDYYVLPLVDGGTGPNYGTVTFNDDCTLTYVPQSGICAVTDQFTYVICNGSACAEAQVEVMLTCTPTFIGGDLLIHSAFSPNGDNINDTFVIEGVENYPENTLFVYNRWGNMVYSTTNYTNDWDGTWKTNILSDGTYFYLFWDGQTQSYSGWVHLQR